MKNPRNLITTTNFEHPAVLRTCEFLEKFGFEITYLPVDKEGLINLNDLEDTIRDRSILITIIHASNEVGTIEPIKEIGEIAYKHGILFHTYAVQSVGKRDINLK